MAMVFHNHDGRIYIHDLVKLDGFQIIGKEGKFEVRKNFTIYIKNGIHFHHSLFMFSQYRSRAYPQGEAIPKIKGTRWEHSQNKGK